MATAVASPVKELAALAVDSAMLALESIALAQHARRIEELLEQVRKIKAEMAAGR